MKPATLWTARLLPRSLQFKLTLLVTVLLILLAGLIGFLLSDSIRNLLLQEIGKKALVLAESIARNPAIRDGLEARDAKTVQELVERIRRASDSEYIVVADLDAIRYSHPVTENIGRRFVGEDFQKVLEQGESYVSQAVGTLGPSMRGFAPMRGRGGDVIGFVAVGYLESGINARVRAQQRDILGYAVFVLLLGIAGAALIARTFKAAIFGLEPHEIASMFQERSAIISAIREGVVAVDGDGRVTLVNEAARRYLDQGPDEDLRGSHLSDLCPSPEMEQALAAGERLLDHELPFAGRTMIVNMVPLKGNGGPSGAVASFRPKDELDRVARELLHVQQYSELLRVQTHEYSNKLHTIAGLIQIGACQEALELVMAEASGTQELVKTLARAVPDPVVSGIILGKFSRARELRIDFSLNPESSFADLPAQIDRGHLMTVIGNLCDNAFEAVREAGEHGEVRVFLTDLGLDLIIEVEDSGRGVSPEVADMLFEKGVSTHGDKGRGMGLYLVRRAVEALGGNITFARGELGGALFTVSVPKRPARETGTRDGVHPVGNADGIEGRGTADDK